MDNVETANTGNFTDVFGNAVEWVSNAGTIMQEFYNCLPAEVQTVLFMLFVLSFGFAFLFHLIRIFT